MLEFDYNKEVSKKYKYIDAVSYRTHLRWLLQRFKPYSEKVYKDAIKRLNKGIRTLGLKIKNYEERQGIQNIKGFDNKIKAIDLKLKKYREDYNINIME